MKRKSQKNEYYCISQLQERGWTKTMISKFLKKHDREKPNPRYRCAAPMKLYLIKRVEKIEGSQVFKKALEKAEKRKDSAWKAYMTKMHRIMDYATTVEISIPAMNYERLIYLACDHYNERKWEIAERRGEYNYIGDTASPEYSDKEFLHRISVNFLRHQCTDYDDELWKLSGKVGIQAAHDILKERINDEIYKTYPMLQPQKAEEMFYFNKFNFNKLK